jgi:hypothetical protein
MACIGSLRNTAKVVVQALTWDELQLTLII